MSCSKIRRWMRPNRYYLSPSAHWHIHPACSPLGKDGPLTFKRFGPNSTDGNSLTAFASLICKPFFLSCSLSFGFIHISLLAGFASVDGSLNLKEMGAIPPNTQFWGAAGASVECILGPERCNRLSAMQFGDDDRSFLPSALSLFSRFNTYKKGGRGRVRDKYQSTVRNRRKT